MKWRYRVFIFLSFMPIQTLLLEQVRLGGVKPDLGLVLVYLLGLFYGKIPGFLWGILLGGMVDFFSVGFLGVDFGLKTLIGYLAGVLGRSLLNLTFVVNTAAIFLVSVLHDLIGTFFLYGMKPDGIEGLASLIRNEVIPRGIYNSLLAGALFFILSKTVGVKGSSEYEGTIFPLGGKSGLTG